MEQIFNQFNSTLGGSISSIIGALLFFIVGWIFALIAGSLVRKLLSNFNVNGRFNQAKTGTKGTDFEKIAARLVFWFVLVIAITGALNLLKIEAISTPFANLVTQVTSFLPKLVMAGIAGLIGWAIATLVRTGITTVLGATTLDEKLSNDAGVEPMSDNIASIFYWLILLFTIPVVLEILGMHDLLVPINNMFGQLFSALPNIFKAALIGFIGYVVAKILRSVVGNLVASLDVQKLTDKTGVTQETNLPKLAGMVVFFLVMVPVIIAALDALKIEAISRPATNMLNQLMSALPNILGAALILGVLYFVARFVANMVSALLESSGVNQLPEKMGVAEVFGETKLSNFAGWLIIFFTMLFAVIAAADRLNLGPVSDILSMFIAFGAKILLGAVILVIGFWLANLASRLVANAQEGSAWLASLVKVLVMGLVLAMGLKAMGIADSIVNLAFGLTLGGAAVAFALAFGLGGQEAAGRVLKSLLDKIDRDNNRPTGV